VEALGRVPKQLPLGSLDAEGSQVFVSRSAGQPKLPTSRHRNATLEQEPLANGRGIGPGLPMSRCRPSADQVSPLLEALPLQGLFGRWDISSST